MKKINPLMVEVMQEEQSLPDLPGIKEMEALAEKTRARITDMKYKALLQGYVLRGLAENNRNYLEESKEHFKYVEPIPKEGVPRMKLRDLIALNKREA